MWGSDPTSTAFSLVLAEAQFASPNDWQSLPLSTCRARPLCAVNSGAIPHPPSRRPSMPCCDLKNGRWYERAVLKRNLVSKPRPFPPFGPYITRKFQGSTTVKELVDCVTAPVPSALLQVKLLAPLMPCQSRKCKEAKPA